MNFIGAALPLDDGDIVAEARLLGCEAAAIWAVCDVESSGSGFLADKRPKILFEAHYFHTLTEGQYDRSHPNISSPHWDRSLYGAAGAHQYDRLAEAFSLNETAAIESASWGRFQIMGANFKLCGYMSIASFIDEMMADEANHLKAFSEFCKSIHLVQNLIDHDWAHFALRYNGSGNVADYAGKLARAYKRHLVPILPDGLRLGSKGPAVVTLQIDLANLGYGLIADGDFGARTEIAVKAFQKKYNIIVDGIVGPLTQNIIEVAVGSIGG